MTWVGLICAELKRSISRALVAQGLTVKDAGYKTLSKTLRKAAFQAARQAFIAMKRPTKANSNVILFAAVGPFWMWCSPSRNHLLGIFRKKDVEEILDQAQDARDEDNFNELASLTEPERVFLLGVRTILHSSDSRWFI